MARTTNGIYYPDDYTEVADIPEDMKKMAESTDEALENLNENKVDKVAGKELSTNDFTNEYKQKVDNNENEISLIQEEIGDIESILEELDIGGGIE